MSWNKRAKQDLVGQPEAVYSAALSYLSRRDYAGAELGNRLLERGADPDVVAAVLERLRSQKYLDDQRFALGRVRQRRTYNGRSRIFIRQELRELGVDDVTVQLALDEEYTETQEAELLEQLVRAELRRFPKHGTREQKRKFMQSVQRRLAAKGFSPGEAYRLLCQFSMELEEDVPCD